MQIETVAINNVKVPVKTLRHHPECNITAIADSIKLFGQQKPVLIDASNTIISGTGIYLALMKLNSTTIDIVHSNLNGEPALAYSVVDNKCTDTSLFSEPDLQSIASYLAEDYNLENLGFNDNDVKALLDPEPIVLPPEADGVEYDESIINSVQFCVCCACGHKWAK